MNVFPVKNLREGSPIWTVCKTVWSNWLDEYGVEDGKLLIPVHQNRLINQTGLVVEFNKNDFINPSSYKGFCKLYKCNLDKPQYIKRNLGNKLGWTHLLGFKLTDYDKSTNVLIISNPNFLHIMKGKMVEEFVSLSKDKKPLSYPPELYLGDDNVPYNYEYDRDWEYIKGLTPQEKIVLANAHNEEAFPNSYYENDRGLFNKRVRELQLKEFLDYELNNHFNIVEEIKTIEDDYFEENNEDIPIDMLQNELDREYREYQNQNDLIREDFFSNVQEGFDYSSWEMSDLYTRTPTLYEDYELYPVRVNCTPKSIRKKGKSPYDTKIGFRQWKYVNHYKKPKRLVNWVNKKTPKYNYQKDDLEVEYDLPENFWEEIEMAYQSR